MNHEDLEAVYLLDKKMDEVNETLDNLQLSDVAVETKTLEVSAICMNCLSRTKFEVAIDREISDAIITEVIRILKKRSEDMYEEIYAKLKE